MTKAIQKHKMGAPTKYKPEVFKKIEQYLAMCGREQTSLPTIEGLAQHLDINSDTIREWVKKYPDFSATIKKLADKQKQQLMDDGMYGGKEINAAMAIFLLKCNHGMKDGSQVAIQVNIKPILGGSSVQANFRNEEDIETVQEN